MYCQSCGLEIDNNQITCSNCGSINPRFKNNFNKKLVIILVPIIVIIMLIGISVNNNIKIKRHNELIEKVSTSQTNLYQHTLIPTLLGNLSSYLIKDIECNEINTEGKAQYGIKINSTIQIGDRNFQYPIIILFNDNNINDPQYIHDIILEQDIANCAKKYKEDKDKQDRLNERIKMTAKDLYNAYDKNEVNANDKYTGRTGIITGKIDSINISLGTPNIRLSTNNSYLGIVCYFKDNSYNETLSKLRKGQTITINGEIKGKTFVDVTLDNCSF